MGWAFTIAACFFAQLLKWPPGGFLSVTFVCPQRNAFFATRHLDDYKLLDSDNECLISLTMLIIRKWLQGFLFQKNEW